MFRVACLLIVVLVNGAVGQTRQQVVNKPDGNEQELAALVRAECEGVLENHQAVLDRVWADEFLMHTVDGHRVPKAQAGPYLRAALPPSIAGLCEIRDLVIKVRGRKATTVGRMGLKAMAADGSEVPLQFRFSQNLVWRQHRWQATYLEFSPDQP